MTSFVLKIIAMVTMIIDHSGDVFSSILNGKAPYFNTVGRIAFPLFCFMLVEGYRHTSNLKKYIIRLLIAALISQIPFHILVVNIMHAKSFGVNVLFTLMFGLIALYIWNMKPESNGDLQNENAESTQKSFTIKDVVIWIMKIIAIALLIVIATWLNFDYGKTGILLILAIFLLFKKHKILFFFAFITISVINYLNILLITPIWGMAFVLASTIIPFIFMLLYNGKKGKNTKYGLYIIYPLHLIILELIYYFLIN